LRDDAPASPIPLHRATPVGRELDYVQQAIAGGRIGGGGPFGARCAALLSQRLDGAPVLVTKSCTAALEIMAHLLGLRDGDEVVLPSFAYVSTANAFALRGARPVFVDVEPGTLNIDPARVRDALGPRTRAVVALHYAGVGCAMDRLQQAVADRGVPLVEDNAHGLGGRFRGRPLGTFGALSAISFHETKALTCGEGGALAVLDPGLLERAEVLAAKGTDRSRFLRGEVGRYTWQDLGSSYELSDLEAAFLCAQLEEFDAVQARRARQWRRYALELGGWAAAQGVELPRIPDGSESSHQTFHLLLPRPEARDRFLAAMAERGVKSAFHFLPLHLSPMGRRAGGVPGQCPVAEDASARLARLPLFDSMTAAEQDRVLDAVSSFVV
jgi:dTDP-4-amino-4,6-dideoxygalactose transaminase